MTPLEVLRAAREKIAVPERWSRWSIGETESGEPVAAIDDSSVRWNIVGAVLAVGDEWVAGSNAIRCLRHAIGVSSISYWEQAPGRTHAEVLAAFDKAVVLAESEGAQ